MRRAIFLGCVLWMLPHIIGNFAHDVVETYRTGTLPLFTLPTLLIMAAAAFWPERKERGQ